jgi:hypothetical protein
MAPAFCLQLPDTFFRRACGKLGITLPALGQYGVGMVFLPQEPGVAHGVRAGDRARNPRRGPGAARWRDVPTRNAGLSVRTKEVEPVIRQVFVARGPRDMDQDALERKLYVIRKRAGHAIQALSLKHGKEFYVPSFSTRTIVYKGMLLAQQVGEYYADLHDESMVSRWPMVHQRFSTNTFPPGTSRIRSASSATTARSTRCAATSTGSARAKAPSRPKSSADDLSKLWPLIYDGQSGFGVVRQRARAACDGRLLRSRTR